MSAEPAGPAASARAGRVALAATLAIQAYTAVVASAPAVLAPMLAADLGITPKWIGVFVSLMYVGAMAGSLLCGEFITRHGAIRVSQVAVGFCAVGIALIASVPASAPTLLVVAAIVAGCGYGPITAASSEVLARTTPPSRMAITFSIKQTGVPGGAALAGAILPALALLAGWRAAFLVIAATGIVVILAAEPTRRALDVRHAVRHPLSLTMFVGPLRTLAKSRQLFELSLVGLVFAGVQTSLSSFLVVYLTDGLDWSLVAGGLALTFATMSAVPGRILWGYAADRFWPANRILGGIGLVASLCGVAMALATSHWPTGIVLALAATYGATAIGWNGVQLSELARRAPPGMAAAVTGASGFVTFGGVVLGPLLFSALAGATGGYRTGFLVSATVGGLVSAVLLWHGSRRE